MSIAAVTTSADPVAAPARPPRERLAMLDAMRGVAAVGIIWLHTVESPRFNRLGLGDMGRFCVPYFGAAAVLLTSQSLYANPSRRWGRFAVGRAHRLLVPFLAWTVIYLVVRNAKARFLTGSEPAGWDWHNFIAGSAQHLWFLPALFVVSVLLFPVQRWSARHRRGGQAMAAAALVAGALWCLLAKPFRVPDDPMTVSWQVQLLGSQTWDMTPALLWGLAAGVWFKDFPAAVRSRAVAVAGIIVAVVATALVCRGGRNIALENVAGIGCLAFALGRWQGSSWVDRLARLGVLAYGIYLCHILWVQGGRSIARKLGLAPSAPLDVSVFAASTVLSILMAWGLSRSRATRWLVA